MRPSARERTLSLFDRKTDLERGERLGRDGTPSSPRERRARAHPGLTWHTVTSPWVWKSSDGHVIRAIGRTFQLESNGRIVGLYSNIIEAARAAEGE